MDAVKKNKIKRIVRNAAIITGYLALGAGAIYHVQTTDWSEYNAKNEAKRREAEAEVQAWGEKFFEMNLQSGKLKYVEQPVVEQTAEKER